MDPLQPSNAPPAHGDPNGTQPFSLTDSNRIRNAFAFCSAIFAAAICLFFSILAFRKGLWAHSGVLVVFFALTSTAALCFRQRPDNALPRWILAATCVVLSLYIYYSGGTYGIGIVWSLITPIFVFFVVGLRGGFFLTTFHFLACLAIYSLAKFAPHLADASYEDGVAISVLAIYAFTAFIVVVYEYSQTLDRKRLAEQNAYASQMAQNAQSASKARSHFLMQMSHEIRTPMNAVLGMADLLEESPLSPDQLHYLRILQSSGKHLLGVINDILDYSRLEAHHVQIEELPFDLYDAAENCARLIAVKALEKALEIECSIAPDVPRFIVGDELRLRQIMLNLMGNAIKFTEEGKITLEFAIEEPNRLRLAVRDTGVGIPPAKIPLLFRQFSQADSSITRRYGGTGLGLAITREIVDLMGGSIRVESREGHGSSFIAILPFRLANSSAIASKIAADAADRDHPAVLLPPMKILVVDDVAVNRDMIKFFLQRQPVEIDEAANGLDAVARCAQTHYDVVLMDLEMPEMDGITATAEIRKAERESGRPPALVYALTAHALQDLLDRTLHAGAQRALTKPIRKRDLLEALRQGVAPDSPPLPSAPPPPPPPPDAPAPPPIDIPRLVHEFDGDETMAMQLLRSMLAQCPDQTAAMRSALDARNFEDLRRAAHKIKGAAANLAADPLARAAAELEAAARAADYAAAASLIDSLQSACRDLSDYVTKNSNPIPTEAPA